MFFYTIMRNCWNSILLSLNHSREHNPSNSLKDNNSSLAWNNTILLPSLVFSCAIRSRSDSLECRVF